MFLDIIYNETIFHFSFIFLISNTVKIYFQPLPELRSIVRENWDTTRGK